MSDKHRNQKKYAFYPRWKFVLELTTTFPLHIGSGEITHRDNLTVKEDNTESERQSEPDAPRKADITACIKDGRGRPFIPSSTIKGKVRQWLEERLIADTVDNEQPIKLLQHLLGHGRGNGAEDVEREQGGSAEFLAASLSKPLVLSEEEIAPPYWDQEQQTAVETSIAVDRVTRTAADKKLFYREVVPPGVGFRLTVVGAMPRQQAALLAAALKTGCTAAQPISFGGDTANGGGRMQFEHLKIDCLGKEEIAQWLRKQDSSMAEASMRDFSQQETDRLVAEGNRYLSASTRSPHVVTVNLRFAGPFLVNDSSRCKKSGDASGSSHIPLQDKQGSPILPAQSVRGALRSQAEKIVRTLGAPCCDPANSCLPIYKKEEVQGLCPVCQLFGSTGWQSRIRISKIAFLGRAVCLQKEKPAPSAGFCRHRPFSRR